MSLEQSYSQPSSAEGQVTDALSRQTLTSTTQTPLDEDSVSSAAATALEIWRRNLDGLLKDADRHFGDISWECEGRCIWAHKGEFYTSPPSRLMLTVYCSHRLRSGFK